jgi:hypothetical protein
VSDVFRKKLQRDKAAQLDVFGSVNDTDWHGGSTTMVNMKSPNRFEVGANTGVVSTVESYTWNPSHDQCGMLRPSGTSSADWW